MIIRFYREEGRQIRRRNEVCFCFTIQTNRFLNNYISLRTFSFIYGGHLDQFIGEDGNCEYDRLFYVSDWFATLLQMADGKLRKHDIDEIVSSYMTLDCGRISYLNVPLWTMYRMVDVNRQNHGNN